MAKELKFIISAENKAKEEIDKIKRDVDGLQDSVKKMQPAFKTMAVVGAAGFAAITGAITLSVKETIQMEAAQNRLSHILRTATKATDEQIQSLFIQAKALEGVGVVSADSVIQAQAQLATFDLQAESIERLIPSILDYVVAEKGASASTEDLKQLTNGLAQALQGNFASLTKTGFVLDEATRELIANGTEAERTAALVEVLNSTYMGFNEAARNTAEGGLVVLKNEFNNLKQTIGGIFLPIVQELSQALTPLLQNIAKWIEQNPDLTKKILLVAGALSGLLLIIGTLGLILPSIIGGFGAMITVLGFLISPIGLVILAILGIAAAVIYVIKNWENFKEGLRGVWEVIKDIFQRATDWIKNLIFYMFGPAGILIKTIIDNWTGLKNFFSEFWENVKNVTGRAIDWLMNKIQPFIDAFDVVKSGISWVGEKAGGAVSSAWEWTKGLLGGGQFGIDNVPRSGAYYLHKGETVVPPGHSVGGGITVNINGGYYLSEMVAEEMGNMIIKKLKQVIKI